MFIPIVREVGVDFPPLFLSLCWFPSALPSYLSVYCEGWPMKNSEDRQETQASGPPLLGSLGIAGLWETLPFAHQLLNPILEAKLGLDTPPPSPPPLSVPFSSSPTMVFLCEGRWIGKPALGLNECTDCQSSQRPAILEPLVLHINMYVRTKPCGRAQADARAAWGMAKPLASYTNTENTSAILPGRVKRLNVGCRTNQISF